MTFDEWCIHARDGNFLINGKPVPLVTTLLYRVCDGDHGKFDHAMRILKRAFEDGHASAKGGWRR
ncbi:hypothetical protein [Hyphomicrobium sp.]|uniref:hypothetical protein n=1 Tax=Hyphomicrobium sp. TaxID=82 RepID=UPI001D259A9F|nr:hypothetical protein [Hyphomicrobium sp.]MBY0561444.1 hypothetical protein [Hyphomicrobium sp.]